MFSKIRSKAEISYNRENFHINRISGGESCECLCAKNSTVLNNELISAISPSLCLKSENKVSTYGKKLAAIFEKSNCNLGESKNVICLKNFVNQSCLARKTPNIKKSEPRNSCAEKLARGFQKLMTKSKNINCQCNQATSQQEIPTKESPHCCSVQQKYISDHLTYCLGHLLENVVGLKCYFPNKKQESSTKKTKLKKKRSKTNKLVKVRGDCICNSAFCRRKSYRPNWDSSIGRKFDTQMDNKSKCVQAGKFMTVEEMIKWDNKIKQRKGLECKPATHTSKNLVPEKPKSAIGERNKINDIFKKSTTPITKNFEKGQTISTLMTKPKSQQINKSTSDRKFSNQQCQCERDILEDLMKPSLISVCIQCSSLESSAKPKEALADKSRIKAKKEKREKADKNLSKKDERNEKRSRNAKRDCCLCHKDKNHGQTENSSDDEETFGMTKGLFRILDNILKRKLKNMEENQSTNKTDAFYTPISNQPQSSRHARKKCCTEYPTKSKCTCSPENHSKSKAMKYKPMESVDNQQTNLSPDSSRREQYDESSDNLGSVTESEPARSVGGLKMETVEIVKKLRSTRAHESQVNGLDKSEKSRSDPETQDNERQSRKDVNNLKPNKMHSLENSYASDNSAKQQKIEVQLKLQTYSISSISKKNSSDIKIIPLNKKKPSNNNLSQLSHELKQQQKEIEANKDNGNQKNVDVPQKGQKHKPKQQKQIASNKRTYSMTYSSDGAKTDDTTKDRDNISDDGHEPKIQSKSNRQKYSKRKQSKDKGKNKKIPSKDFPHPKKQHEEKPSNNNLSQWSHEVKQQHKQIEKPNEDNGNKKHVDAPQNAQEHKRKQQKQIRSNKRTYSMTYSSDGAKTDDTTKGRDNISDEGHEPKIQSKSNMQKYAMKNIPQKHSKDKGKNKINISTDFLHPKKQNEEKPSNNNSSQRSQEQKQIKEPKEHNVNKNHVYVPQKCPEYKSTQKKQNASSIRTYSMTYSSDGTKTEDTTKGRRKKPADHQSKVQSKSNRQKNTMANTRRKKSKDKRKNKIMENQDFLHCKKSKNPQVKKTAKVNPTPELKSVRTKNQNTRGNKNSKDRKKHFNKVSTDKFPTLSKSQKKVSSEFKINPNKTALDLKQLCVSQSRSSPDTRSQHEGKKAIDIKHSPMSQSIMKSRSESQGRRVKKPALRFSQSNTQVYSNSQNRENKQMNVKNILRTKSLPKSQEILDKQTNYEFQNRENKQTNKGDIPGIKHIFKSRDRHSPVTQLSAKSIAKCQNGVNKPIVQKKIALDSTFSFPYPSKRIIKRNLSGSETLNGASSEVEEDSCVNSSSLETPSGYISENDLIRCISGDISACCCDSLSESDYQTSDYEESQMSLQSCQSEIDSSRKKLNKRKGAKTKSFSKFKFSGSETNDCNDSKICASGWNKKPSPIKLRSKSRQHEHYPTAKVSLKDNQRLVETSRYNSKQQPQIRHTAKTESEKILTKNSDKIKIERNPSKIHSKEKRKPMNASNARTSEKYHSTQTENIKISKSADPQDRYPTSKKAVRGSAHSIIHTKNFKNEKNIASGNADKATMKTIKSNNNSFPEKCCQKEKQMCCETLMKTSESNALLSKFSSQDDITKKLKDCPEITKSISKYPSKYSKNINDVYKLTDDETSGAFSQSDECECLCNGPMDKCCIEIQTIQLRQNSNCCIPFESFCDTINERVKSDSCDSCDCEANDSFNVEELYESEESYGTVYRSDLEEERPSETPIITSSCISLTNSFASNISQSSKLVPPTDPCTISTPCVSFATDCIPPNDPPTPKIPSPCPCDTNTNKCPPERATRPSQRKSASTPAVPKKKKAIRPQKQWSSSCLKKCVIRRYTNCCCMMYDPCCYYYCPPCTNYYY